MNTWTIAGRIGRDAETRHTGSGKAVTNFSVAVDEYAGAGERNTLWVSCAMWGERGEKLAQYLVKGASVTVSGNAGVRTYEGNAGTRAEMTMNVREITMQGGKESGRVGSDTPPQRQSKQASSGNNHSSTRGEPPADFEDDIPF